jgi:hypothetical protein
MLFARRRCDGGRSCRNHGWSPAERAVAFGSQQLLLQNRGLFDLLEARASARGDS